MSRPAQKYAPRHCSKNTLRCEGLYRDDPEADIGRMGFKRGHQCAELIYLMRVLVEGSLEWGETVMVAQIDLIRAYDSVRHGGVLASMRRPEVPEALAAAYLR